MMFMILDNFSKILLVFFLSLSCNFVTGQALSWDKCNRLYKSYQDEKLKSYLDSSIVVLKSSKDKVAYFYFLSKYYRSKGDTENQIKNLRFGFDLISKSTFSDSIHWKYKDELALAYRANTFTKDSEAFDYINESLALKHLAKDSSELSDSYRIKGNLFFSSSAIIGAMDSAAYCYSKALAYTDDEQKTYANLYNLASASIYTKSNFDIESTLLEVIEYSKVKKYYRRMTRELNTLALFYRESGAFIKAETILDTLLSYATENKWSREVGKILGNRVELSKQKGSIEEMNYWQDSLEEYKLIITEPSITALIEKNDLLIELAHKETQSYRNKLWLSILAGTTGSLCVFLIGLYKYFRLRRRTLQQELETTKIKANLDTTKAKMEGEQKERQAIAAVLHDQVASLLTAADMHIKAAENSETDSASLNKAGEIIKDVNDQVRDLSHQLVSPTLLKFGLEAAIDSLAVRLDSDSLQFHFESDLNDKRFDGPIETFIYNSCSELMQNVIKHSTGDTCEIKLTHQSDEINLQVHDNGTNENIPAVQSRGLGIPHIKERASALGGSFSFNITADGALAILELPIQ